MAREWGVPRSLAQWLATQWRLPDRLAVSCLVRVLVSMLHGLRHRVLGRVRWQQQPQG